MNIIIRVTFIRSLETKLHLGVLWNNLAPELQVIKYQDAKLGLKAMNDFNVIVLVKILFPL